MKVKTVTLHKNYHVGLPLYSNMDIGMTLTFEVGEGEEPNIQEGFDMINQHMQIQSGSIDPSWISYDQTAKEWKYTIRIPKSEYKK